MELKLKFFVTLGVCIGLVVLLFFVTRTISTFTGYSVVDVENTAALVECMNSKGVKMYGASWCPHCRDQKAMFGYSAGELGYIECTNSSECEEKGITGYPTWIINDKKYEGVQSLSKLKELSGC